MRSTSKGVPLWDGTPRSTSVHTPYLSDVTVEDAVREAGAYYLEGRCSLEEAMENIRERIAIYMAE